MEVVIALAVLAIAAAAVWYFSRRAGSGDDSRYIESIRKAALSGDVIAQYKLAAMCYEGRETRQDSREAAEWYLKAAQQGHVEAQFILGIMYERGDGVERNDGQAYHWISLAAREGHARARTLLESDKWLLYLNGKKEEPEDGDEPGIEKQGVTGDQLEEYRRKAGDGDVDAQYNLGVIYYHGEGAPRSFEEAFNWFRQAAEQDDPDAQYNLGFMYGRGEGVPKDQARSVQWFKRAAELGHEGARDILEKMAGRTVPGRKP